MATYGYTFTSGDSVTPTKLNSARTVSEIVNADIKSDAAIAGTKIAPAFGGQDITVSTANRSITNTGNFALSFGTNNTERVRITNDGLVGIGTGSPLARLSIDRDQASTVTNVLTLNNAGGGSGNGAALNFYASPTAQPFTARINTVDNGNFGFDLVFSNKPSGSAGAGALTERLRIDSSGNLLVSRTTTAAGNSGWYFGPSGIARGEFNSGQVFVLNRIDVDGTAIGFHRAGVQVGEISVTTTATTYSTSSDYRLKENAAPLTGGLSTVSQLNPVSFKWKSDGSTGYGFIAHELQAVVPEAVTGEKDAVDADGKPQYQGVDASKLVPYLVAAVQELSARVEALEAAQ